MIATIAAWPLSRRLALLAVVGVIPLATFNLVSIWTGSGILSTLDAMVAADHGRAADLAPVADAVRRSLVLILASCGLGLLLVPPVLWLFFRDFVGPVRDITRVLHEVAEGRIEAPIPFRDRAGEVGQIARAVDVLRAAMIATLKGECQALQSQRDFAARRSVLALTDAVAGEMSHTIQAVGARMEETAAAATTTARRLGSMTESSATIAAEAESMAMRVDAIAATTSELIAATGEISRQVCQAAKAAEAANSGIDRTVAELGEMTTVIRQVGGVTQMIAGIASQTNLLALNATIEAARAGEAGKGFAVVAGEVKHLANQTAMATDEITAMIEALTGAGNRIVQSIGGVAAIVREVDEMAVAVAAAVEEQEASTREIGRNADDAADVARHTAGAVGHISEETVGIGAAADTSTRAVAAAERQLDVLGQRMHEVLRQSTRSDERRDGPMPVPVHLFDSGFKAFPVTGLSLTGCVATIPVPAEEFPLTIPMVGGVTARVVERRGGGTRLAFAALPPGLHLALDQLLAGYRAVDAAYVVLAQRVAAEVAATFEQALSTRALTEEDLFDEEYVPVAGSDPAQVMTRFVAFTDARLPAIQEPACDALPGIMFTVAVDRNGYLPTHRMIYNQPQRPGDPAWNAANCRNRRIFDDRTGLAAGRSTAPSLIQTYLRDMGAGNYVLMQDVSAPITIRGRHWGGVRIGYKTE